MKAHGRTVWRGVARAAAAALALAGALGAGAGCDSRAPDSGEAATPAGPAPPTAPRKAAAPAYVGSRVCAGCHAEEARRWHGSDHDLAMQEAREDTVLGDFERGELSHFGVVTRFFRRDGRFFVNAEGPLGTLRDYEVAYTFGVDPLQQYLIRFPGGRLQALDVAWDARPAERGGQRWFSLHPDEPIPPTDVLHWTGPAMRWNSMCADCHSTGLERGYDLASDRYDTTWAEIDVACEACHGPGAAHVAWAKAGGSGDPGAGLAVHLRNEAEWRFAPGAAIAHRSPARASAAELDTCAPCHSRRTPIAVDTGAGDAFLDGYRPALLDEGLYYADGQIQDEVYVWGSFVQSGMYAAGVTCSDCHDPHSLRIEEPDAACARCHRPEVFAAASHHHHPEGSVGASCVACHMPARTYMVIDDRRDHGFRVPRPGQSASLGAPDACTGCHAEREPAWAAQTLQSWAGGRAARRPDWPEAIREGRERWPDADRALARVATSAEVPAIARATALSLLGNPSHPAAADALRRAIPDPQPLVRMAAAGAAEGLAPRDRAARVAPLLRDPLRAVRIEAARVLAAVPADALPPTASGPLHAALEEYRAAQRVQPDRPESHLNLGVLDAQRGDLESARHEYETAMRLGPYFAPAYVNLADLLRLEGRDGEGERVLRRGLSRVPAPHSAGLHYALGLLLVRQGKREQALGALARASVLEQDEPHYTFVYALALRSEGRIDEAQSVLEGAIERHPHDRELRAALAEIADEKERSTRGASPDSRRPMQPPRKRPTNGAPASPEAP